MKPTHIPVLLFLLLSPLLAQANAFINVPGLPGESTDPDHPGWIEVKSWVLDFHNTNPQLNSGQGAGERSKPGLGSITLEKAVDSTSVLINQNCCNGKHYSGATLIMRKAGGAQQEYVRIEMKNIMITSVSTSGSSGDPVLVEEVTFNFEKIKFDYMPTAPDGSFKPDVKYEWALKGKKILQN